MISTSQIAYVSLSLNQHLSTPINPAPLYDIFPSQLLILPSDFVTYGEPALLLSISTAYAPHWESTHSY